jgi:1-acyl-sn-glycerol-3-phosphate acyltransferase
MRFMHWAVTSTIKLLTHVLCRVDSGQLSRVPTGGPLILTTNHVNFLEIPILYTHLHPRPMTAFVKAETWDSPVLGKLADLWGAIPLQRGEADISALRVALKALEDGQIVGVAPEGTRSGNGCLQRGQPGIALLALRSNAPLLPMVSYGGELFWSNLPRLRRTDFHIAVGQPFYLSSNGTKVTREVRQQMTDEIMWQMARLLPPAYRGVYSDLDGATAVFLRFLFAGESTPAGSDSLTRS